MRCATLSGARVVALATHRSAQPYEFTYDHVTGETDTQDDMFMRESASCSVQPACRLAQPCEFTYDYVAGETATPACLNQTSQQQGFITGARCSAKNN